MNFLVNNNENYQNYNDNIDGTNYVNNKGVDDETQ